MTDNLLENKKFLENYLKRRKYSSLSAYSFVSIYAWRDFFDFDLKIINQNLCVFAGNEAGTFLYLPPLGEDLTAETIDECFQYMRVKNGPGGVTRVENVSEDQLPVFPENRFRRYLKSHDYCYLREDILSLSGRRYKSQRNSLNRFLRSKDYEYLSYVPSMSHECLALYREWAQERRRIHHDGIYQDMIKDNEKVHQRILENSEEIGLTGRVVKVKGEIRAYTFGFGLSDEMFCVYLETADLKVKGLPTFIFHEFCSDSDLKGYKFINCMDDFELPNIRRTKMSYHPALLVPSYVVTQKDLA